ncbi:MAG: hypothetical protein KGY67_00400 [Candidatus Thermoplasmatota archaeon]|nr:hypothetical protein [Candidatus Thermoplasmatota archaeon]
METFVGEYDQKYLGKIITDKQNEKFFITSLKQRGRHYYFKGQGYPVNKELIHMLRKINVNYIIIPEQRNQTFKTYLATTEQYYKGRKVKEKHVEEQRVIPLKKLKEITFPKEKIKQILY